MQNAYLIYFLLVLFATLLSTGNRTSQHPNPDATNVIHLIYGGITALLCGIFIWFIYRVLILWILSNRGEKISGSVRSKEDNSSYGSSNSDLLSRRYILYHFMHESKEYFGKSRVSSYLFSTLHSGDAVNIAYWKSDPKVSYIAEALNWALYRFFVILGIVMITFIVRFSVYTYTPPMVASTVLPKVGQHSTLH